MWHRASVRNLYVALNRPRVGDVEVENQAAGRC